MFNPVVRRAAVQVTRVRNMSSSNNMTLLKQASMEDEIFMRKTSRNEILRALTIVSAAAVIAIPTAFLYTWNRDKPKQ